MIKATIKRHSSAAKVLIEAVLLVVVLFATSPWSQAQSVSQNGAAVDRVWVQPRETFGDQEAETWYPASIQTITGQVTAFDAEHLEIIDASDGVTKRLAADRVIWIQPAGFESLEGPMVQRYQSGQFAESLNQLPEVLKQRPSIWRQQWITMLAANAAWKSGRSKIALELVSQLDRRPLPPAVLTWLPIAWRRGVPSADSVTEAETRLSDASQAVRLVAASWLLASAKRQEATVTIQQLAASDRADMARLATALLWRTASPPQVQQSARQWDRQLNELPLVLQPGPTLALIDQFQAAGLSDEAKHLQWSVELVPVHPRYGD